MRSVQLSIYADALRHNSERLCCVLYLVAEMVPYCLQCAELLAVAVMCTALLLPLVLAIKGHFEAELPLCIVEFNLALPCIMYCSAF